MFIKASNTKKTKTESKKEETPAPKKTIRKTVRITEVPTASPQKQVNEPTQQYHASSFQLNQESVENIWKEIMRKLDEPTHLVFFQTYTPALIGEHQLHLNVASKDADNAKALHARIEKYFKAKTHLPISVGLTISEGSEEEKERHRILKEMITENSSIQELIQNLDLTFE